MMKKIYVLFIALVLAVTPMFLTVANAVTLIEPKTVGNSYVYEVEDGSITGACYTNTTISNSSGGSCINLLNGSVTLNVKVPKSGKYKITVFGANDNNGVRCDYFAVNGGTKYLVVTPASPIKTWVESEPGTENWVDSALQPIPVAGGFELNQGANTFTISANWGYAYYDKIVIKEIEEETDPATKVISLIDSLPEVATEKDRVAVENAKSEYDKLDNTKKSEVTNYEKLLEKLAMINCEVQNPVKDGNKLIYEAEKCTFLGNSAYKSDVYGGFTGDGYIFVMTDGFKIKVNVPVNGTYRLYVACANDNNGGRCDYVSVNGGEKLLIATPAAPAKSWVVSEPGTENWVNDELKPIPKEGGFVFNKGENTIQIDVNWGYAAYDRFILVPTGDTVITDEENINKLNEIISSLPEVITNKEIETVQSAYELFRSLNDNDKAYIKDYTKLICSKAMADEINENPKAKAGSMRYECEEGKMNGNSSVVTEKTVFSDYSGNGYVFLFDKSFDVEVYVPFDGYYDINVISGMTEKDNKCDFLTVNGKNKLLISTDAGKGVWKTSKAGTENWTNGKLVPLAPEKGTYLNKGKNTITISANWGYCAYDAIEIIPRSISPHTADNFYANYILLFVIAFLSVAVIFYSLLNLKNLNA